MLLVHFKLTHRNNFILIKIKFNQAKYQELISNLNYKTLKFKNNKDEFISTHRIMKYKQNNLDPECAILSKKR